MSQTFWNNVKNFLDTRKVLRFLCPSQLVAYTPTWTSASGTPAIGNGTLEGWYVITGYMCMATIELTYGSTSTAGSGTWSFSLPAPRAGVDRWIGSMLIRDNLASPSRRVGVSLIDTEDGDVLRGITDSDTTYVGSANPITWANGDIVLMSIVYPTKWKV